MEYGTSKIQFLQLSRAIACLIVVYTHWYGLLQNPNGIHQFIKQDPISNYPSFYITDYLTIFCDFIGVHQLLGTYFGVGLFFILSGYIIPLSLKNSKPKEFIMRRLFRIYPTLIICLSITVIMVAINHIIFPSIDINSHYSVKQFIYNIFLINSFTPVPYIEFATWTLEIEMRFYLLFFLFIYFKEDKNPRIFIFTLISLFFLAKLIPHLTFIIKEHKLQILANVVALNCMYLSYMFIGTTLYYFTSKQWSVLKSIVCMLVFVGIHYKSFSIYHSAIGISDFIILKNHLYAFGFFVVLYLANSYIPCNKILNYIAEISYPLYLVHGFTGYSLYFVTYRLSHHVLLSFFISIGLVILISCLVHIKIEKPFIELSKKIIKNPIEFSFIPHFLKRRKYSGSEV